MESNGIAAVSGAKIAIIGMAVRVAGARTLAEYFHNIFTGVESVSFFSEAELRAEGIEESVLRQAGYVKAKGIVDGVDRFDGEFFGYSHSESADLDPKTRILHEVAYHALEDAGLTGRHGAAVGVFVGASEDAEWLRRAMGRLPAPGAERLETGLLIHKDQLAQQLAYRLDLRGPTYALYTACSTSLAAVHLACRSVASGECDIALAGGVTLDLPHKSGHAWSEGMVYSRDGHCRPFDADATGFVFGDGAAVVVLKRLPDALADRDRIHAVILGTAVNNDGRRKVGFVAPSLQGQTEVIRAALAAARVASESIGYVEAHGTGTAIGDPVELAGLNAAFGTDKRGFCALGSVKANIGHTHAAAGTAGLIKAALAVREGIIPPLVNFRRPNAQLPLATSPFYLPQRSRPWPATFSVRRAAVSSFGLGGTNAHAVLEAPPQRPPVAAEESFIVPFSARSEHSLSELEIALRALIATADLEELARLAYTQQVGRREMHLRGALLVRLDRYGTRTVRRIDVGVGGSSGIMRLGLWIPDPGALQGLAGLTLRGRVYEACLSEALAGVAGLAPEIATPENLLLAASAGDGLAWGCLAWALGSTLCRLLPGLELAAGSGLGEQVAAAVAGALDWPEVRAALADGGLDRPPRSFGHRAGRPVLVSSLTGKPLEDRELRDETRWRRVLQSNRGDPPAVETTLWCGPGCPPQTFASSGEQDAGDGAWAIAELWCRGFEVDWRGLGSAEVPGLTSSALYPFSGTEHRLPPPMELQEAAAMPPRTVPARRRLPRPSLASPYRAPVTPPATRIVELIEEVLETAPVGMDDGFLELGGDSLAALQLGSRLEKVFGFDLDIAAILDNPSPEALLAHLVELMAAAYRTESRAGLSKAAEAQEVRQ